MKEIIKKIFSTHIDLDEKEIKHLLSKNEELIKIFSIGDGALLQILLPIIILSFFTFGLALILGLPSYLFIKFFYKKSYVYILTNKRIIAHLGFFNKKTISIDYKNITDVYVKQNLIDRIFKIGHVFINTAGSVNRELILKYIQDPQKTVNIINEKKL